MTDTTRDRHITEWAFVRWAEIRVCGFAQVKKGGKISGGRNSIGTGWVVGTQYVWGPEGGWHSSRGGGKKCVGWNETGDVQRRSHRSIAGSLSSWRMMGTISGGLESGMRACDVSLRLSVDRWVRISWTVCRTISSPSLFLVSEGPAFGWCPMSVQPEPCSNEILDSPWTGSPRRVSSSGGHQEFFVSQQRLVCGWWTELKVGVFRSLLTIFFRKGWYAFPLPFTVSPSTSKCWCCHPFLFLSLNSVALTMCESLL